MLTITTNTFNMDLVEQGDLKAALTAFPTFDEVNAAIASALARIAPWDDWNNTEDESAPLALIGSLNNTLLKSDNVSRYAWMQLPLSGVGPFHTETTWDAIVANKGSIDAQVRFGIGVNNALNWNCPQYPPYVSPTHDFSDNANCWITVRAGEAVPIHAVRRDHVDPVLIAQVVAKYGMPLISTWPNWTLGGNPPPLLVPVAGTDTQGAVVVVKCSQFLSKRIG